MSHSVYVRVVFSQYMYCCVSLPAVVAKVDFSDAIKASQLSLVVFLHKRVEESLKDNKTTSGNKRDTFICVRC